MAWGQMFLAALPCSRLRRAAIGTIVFAGAGGLAFLAGFVLIIVACVMISGRTLRPAYRSGLPLGSACLEGFAVYMAAMGLLPLALYFLIPHAPFGTQWLVVFPAIFALMWVRLRGISTPDLRYATGWHLGRGLWREMGAGVLGYLAGIPLIVAAAFAAKLLQDHQVGKATHPIIFEFDGSTLRTLQIFLMASVMAPIIEETMFRGLFLHHLRRRWNWAISAVVVAFLFAVIHPQGMSAVPLLMVIALVLAALREWRGSIVASMTAHALNNLVVTIMLVVALG